MLPEPRHSKASWQAVRRSPRAREGRGRPRLRAPPGVGLAGRRQRGRQRLPHAALAAAPPVRGHAVRARAYVHLHTPLAAASLLCGDCSGGPQQQCTNVQAGQARPFLPKCATGTEALLLHVSSEPVLAEGRTERDGMQVILQAVQLLLCRLSKK